MTPRTMFEKIWDSHVVRESPGKPALIYVDLHLVHEVTSPQAFEGLRMSGRTVRRPELTVSTVDHNVPTIDRLFIKDEISRKQIEALKQNADDIGYTGEAIRALSMEARMTVCNMSIEAGARVGMVAPDEKTFDYIRGRPFAPSGPEWEEAVEWWKQLPTDPGARYDKSITIDGSELEPYVKCGTNPGMVVPVTRRVPDPRSLPPHADRAAAERALEYMALQPDTAIQEIELDRVFIGSCTTARIQALRAAAAVAKGRRVADGVLALVVPGSTQVKLQAEEEGLDRVFTEAGFEWREAGCSMCLGMNPDILQPGERCASSSNRNFEGRQGKGGRTHLVSPQMAAAAAIAGHFVDIREWDVD